MTILWFYSGYDDILVAFKGTRAVSRVPLRKDWFVGPFGRSVVHLGNLTGGYSLRESL
jgi:hypothetical protein